MLSQASELGVDILYAELEDRAVIIVRMATVGPEGPTGTFAGNDGTVPW